MDFYSEYESGSDLSGVFKTFSKKINRRYDNRSLRKIIMINAEVVIKLFFYVLFEATFTIATSPKNMQVERIDSCQCRTYL